MKKLFVSILLITTIIGCGEKPSSDLKSTNPAESLDESNWQCKTLARVEVCHTADQIKVTNPRSEDQSIFTKTVLASNLSKKIFTWALGSGLTKDDLVDATVHFVLMTSTVTGIPNARLVVKTKTENNFYATTTSLLTNYRKDLSDLGITSETVGVTGKKLYPSTSNGEWPGYETSFGHRPNQFYTCKKNDIDENSLEQFQKRHGIENPTFKSQNTCYYKNSSGEKVDALLEYFEVPGKFMLEAELERWRSDLPDYSNLFEYVGLNILFEYDADKAEIYGFKLQSIN